MQKITGVKKQVMINRFFDSGTAGQYAVAMTTWTFLTTTPCVHYVARDPGARVREIADAVGITERTAHGILADLVDAGYLKREKEGRRNRYECVEGPAVASPDRERSPVGGVAAGRCGADLPRRHAGQDREMITVVSAPIISACGRPPRRGSVPGVSKAPDALREAGLFVALARRGARDGGIVLAGRYVDDDDTRAPGSRSQSGSARRPCAAAR